ncbi:MAG: class I mannose-6-phosphate isomerase [Phycisphaerales bacterium]|nr:class I mannose-6-phosphate isomerase [Phycisphaerales bacterium]
MTTTHLPIAPLRFAPITHARVWGGTRLHEVLHKPAATGEPVGESWELSPLPGNESCVTGGPLAGRSLPALAAEYPNELLGDIAERDHAFPLLIKFLDAAQPLSVQVHPKPPASPDAPKVAVKHEAWYIVQANPGAEVYIGLKSGVTADEIARAANTPAMRDLIQARPAKAGDCFYLPSGTLHALGAGLLVAEVQTPSDTTFRIYDWDRVGADGKPRELHIAQAMDNIRYDVADDEIAQARTQLETVGHRRDGVCRCERFEIDELAAVSTSFNWTRRQPSFTIWMMIRGSATLTGDGFTIDARIGDTLLLPAALDRMHVRPTGDFKVLEITAPTRADR